HQPEAAGQLRHVSDPEERAHHARRRVAQRDGDPAGQVAAPHLCQRPLRLGEPRSRRAADGQFGRRPRQRDAAGGGGTSGRRGTPRGRPPGAAPAPADAQARPNQDYNVAAPGANDDGSGTVLSMELARVFAESGIEFDATLVFMAVAGEEQGLIGAGAHAKAAKAQNVPIQAWFNNDIVGGSRGGDGSIDSATVRLYSEGPE